MLARLLGAYRLRSPIGRIDFLIGMLVVGLIWILGQLSADYLAEEFDLSIRTYLLVEWVVGVSSSLIALPIVLARARDISWSQISTFAIFLSPLVLEAFSGTTIDSIEAWWILLSILISFLRIALILSLAMLPRGGFSQLNERRVSAATVFLLVGSVYWTVFVLPEYDVIFRGMSELPALTELVLPLIHWVPLFLIGAVPAIIVLVSKNLTTSLARRLAGAAVAIYILFLWWASVIYFALVIPMSKMQEML